MSDMPVSRRKFIKASAAAGVAAAALPVWASDQTKPDGKGTTGLVPTRKLGKTGVDVSMLNQGTTWVMDPRYMNMMHEEGVRYIDTAASYGRGESERRIADWFQKTGHRKDYFLVTKDSPHNPQQWVEMLDKRLEALQTDYIDLFFIHNLGGDGVSHIADKEWTAAAEKMRKSGKVKHLGFSTHHNPIEARTESLNKAAAGGWVEAIMVATNLTLMRDNKEFNKALDNCHKAGIGLISMKECKDVANVKNVFPRFTEKGLSKFTAVLTAIWTDERFASICSAMDNVQKLRENVAAAKNFKPLTAEEMAAATQMLDGLNRTYCAACDGSCKEAAGTDADLNTIARYVSYVEENGQLEEAKALYAALPAEARNWRGANLEVASHACKCKMNYVRIMEKAERYFA